MPVAKELLGQRFGRLVVLNRIENSIHGKARWLCACDCGERCFVVSGALLNGKSTSCGCERDKRTAARAVIRNTTHGHTPRNGASSEYRSWRAMRNRCKYSGVGGYKNYGGRGITVCERWASFEAFLADMGPKPTPQHQIDRYPNNDGNYEPDNCRWATRKEQAANKRRRADAVA